MKKKTIIILGSVVVVVALIGFSIINGMKPPVLPTATVTSGDVESVASFTGTVKPEKTKAYFAPDSIRVTKVNFEKGDFVKAGDVIAELNQQDINDKITLSYLQYRDAEIAYEEIEYNNDIAEEDYEEALVDIRYYRNRLNDGENIATGGSPEEQAALSAQMQYWEKMLASARSTRDMYEKQFVTDYQFERARNAVKQAEIRYRQTKELAETGKGGIVAEADGIISQMNLLEGSFTSAAQPAVMINHTGISKATFNMGKYDVDRIEVGQQVQVTFGKHELVGKVSRIAGEAITNAAGGVTLEAEVEIDDPQNVLKLGMEVDMEIVTGAVGSVMVIPTESVKVDRDGDFCYLLEPAEKEGTYKPVKKYIQTGLSSDTHIQVISGLSLGDLVVTIAPRHIDQIPLATAGDNSTAQLQGEGVTFGPPVE